MALFYADIVHSFIVILVMPTFEKTIFCILVKELNSNLFV